MPTEEASNVVNDLGIVGSLGVVILILVVALIWVIKNMRGTLDETLKYSMKAEHAVNGVGEGEHRLFDKVHLIQEQVTMLLDFQKDHERRGWRSLPDDLNTAAGLTQTIRSLQDHDSHIQETLDRIETRLIQHVEWEEKEKYNHG